MKLSSFVTNLTKPQSNEKIRVDDFEKVEDDEERIPQKQVGIFNVTQSAAPPYGHRKGWKPQKLEDFGDGGAFPEIHVPQYPLGLGQRSQTGANSAMVTLDSQGHISYDRFTRRNNAGKLSDQLAKPVKDDDALGDGVEEEAATAEQIDKCKEETMRIIGALNGDQASSARPERQIAKAIGKSHFMEFHPSAQGAQYNSGASKRIVQMFERQRDPMEPPSFQINKKIPRNPPSPPATVQHSPTRRASAKELAQFRIPPCVSFWKNQAGYTIPLENRVMTDGSQNVGNSTYMNERFSKLQMALQIAEEKGREATEKREQLQKKYAQREKERVENELQRKAAEARNYNNQFKASMEASETSEQAADRQKRDEMRRDMARNRNRERNLANAGGETKAKLNMERDISEQIALGQPNPARHKHDDDAIFDRRLFGQAGQGLDSGFAGGADDLNNIYDKPWQASQNVAQHIYRPTRQKNRTDLDDDLASGANNSTTAKKTSKTSDSATSDPFKLIEFLGDVKAGGKRSSNHVGGSNGGSSSGDSKKKRL